MPRRKATPISGGNEKPMGLSKDGRARNWSFVIYPNEGDECPTNWRDILDDLHIQWIESPLHDKDTNPTGEIKKPHKHILLMYDGNKSFDQIKAITDALHAPIPLPCGSTIGMTRYMIHLDNPEKWQYDRADIIGHGGADVAQMLKPNSASRYQLIAEMIGWVKENDVDEMCDLMDYAAENRRDDWFPLLSDSCAYIIGEYIRSVRGKKRGRINTVED